MNAPLRPQEIRVDPFEVFELRCWARAALWQAAVLSLQEAVDTLQDFAEVSGLVDRLGNDAVQKMVVDAFAKVCP
jgi:hypothetical protein